MWPKPKRYTPDEFGFEKSGHFVPMEQPEAAADAIFDFLQAEALI
jgi:pimeloyl-ACP methyl ester carboxylesterase